MFKQETLQQGMHLAAQWGWFGTAVVLLILAHLIYTIYSNIKTKNKAFTPITDMKLEIKDRVTYDDLENKLNKYQLKEVADAHSQGIDKRLGHVEDLLKENNRLLQALLQKKT